MPEEPMKNDQPGPIPNVPPGYPPPPQPQPAIAYRPTTVQHAQAMVVVILAAVLGSLLGDKTITGWMALHPFAAAFINALYAGWGVFLVYSKVSTPTS